VYTSYAMRTKMSIIAIKGLKSEYIHIKSTAYEEDIVIRRGFVLFSATSTQ